MAYLYSGMSCSHKKDKILIHATTWVYLENMLSERSQTLSIYEMPRRGKSMIVVDRFVVAKDQKVG